jgi:predicted enzyme related to lactoylglutathione lyase
MSTDPRNNRIDYIELTADDEPALTKAKAFYSQAFGWTYKQWAPHYVDTQSSGVTSGIVSDGEHRQKPLPVIYAEDLQGARNRVLAAGATLTKDIFSFPGGSRFQFNDPAGNELAVWSDK